MSKVIVPLTEEYLDDCVGFFVTAFTAEPWNEEWTPESTRAYLTEQLLKTPGSLGFVWLDQQSRRPCGFVLGHEGVEGKKRVFNLIEVCVSPAQQRRGIGSQLLRHLEQELSRLGVVEISLSTLRGSPAEAFYAKHGYQEGCRVKMFRRLD